MHPFGRWLPLAWHILWHPWVRYIACWVLVIYVGYRLTDGAWASWESEDHPAGTTGHTVIDFGGQWFTGKLILQGEGHFLYERHHIWNVLIQAWPPDDRPLTSVDKDARRLKKWRSGAEQDNHAVELLCCYLMPLGANNNVEGVSAFAGALEAEDEIHRIKYGQDKRLMDADMLLYWLVCVGNDEPEVAKTNALCLLPLTAPDPFGAAALTYAGKQKFWPADKMKKASKRIVGGQLYPPIHAFLYVPLALLDPPDAYRVAIILPMGFALIAGLGLAKATASGIWWPIGTLLTIIFPHFVDAQGLGHNGALIVAIMIWGFYFLNKGADVWGGIVWGLFAYKPSWAVMYFVMLLVSRRWKAAFAMGSCALVQILLTLPFVGIHSWIEWRQVIADAAPGYGIYPNWVHVSRDLFTYPRRAWTDWEMPEGSRDLFESRLVGFILIGIVLEITVRLTTLRGRQSKHWSFAAAAFLMLGFWMCCYHITYYDTIFATLPVALLLLTPSHLWVPYFFRRAKLSWNTKRPTGQETLTLPPRNYGRICNPLIVYVLPLIIWNPWGRTFFDTLGDITGWTFDDVTARLSFASPQAATQWGLWLDQPLIVPLFAILWLWAGWLWLREKGGTESAVVNPSSVHAPWPQCPPHA